MVERKMKSSDSRLQVLMDEAQEKQQGPHLTVSERNHSWDGVSPCESDVVCECNPPDCEGWEFDLRGKKNEVTIIHPFILLFFERGTLGQLGVAS